MQGVEGWGWGARLRQSARSGRYRRSPRRSPVVMGKVTCAVQCCRSVQKTKSLNFYKFPKDDKCLGWIQSWEVDEVKDKLVGRLQDMQICSAHLEKLFKRKKLLSIEAPALQELTTGQADQPNCISTHTEILSQESWKIKTLETKLIHTMPDVIPVLKVSQILEVEEPDEILDDDAPAFIKNMPDVISGLKINHDIEETSLAPEWPDEDMN